MGNSLTGSGPNLDICICSTHASTVQIDRFCVTNMIYYMLCSMFYGEAEIPQW